MRDFTIKLATMDNLFICKFGVSDYINQQFKIYYISPDGDHQYLSIDNIQNTDHQHDCYIGTLYMDGKTNQIFEDTHQETFTINRKDYKDFVGYLNILEAWDRSNIGDIEKNYGKNLVL
jgi:hypothetical protein